MEKKFPSGGQRTRSKRTIEIMDKEARQKLEIKTEER